MRNFAKRLGVAALIVGLASATAGPAAAGTITTYSDQPTFSAALGGPQTTETFGQNFQFPITTGVLNSQTSLDVQFGPPITPGEIAPGVTYSTPIGSQFFFNIDQGGGFDGGFLDSLIQNQPVTPSQQALTTTFDSPVAGFGFNTTNLMGSELFITINFTSGPSYSQSFAIGAGEPFFGFTSSATDITSATIYGNSSAYSFAIDNFIFPTPAVSSVPEPSSLAMCGIAGLVGLAAARTRRPIAA